jgi:hypothetical protein
MAFIGPGMDGNAVRTGCDACFCRFDNVRYIERTLISQKRNFIQIYT